MEIAPRLPVPVFPLPGMVLFPHLRVPLHVFELRYRTMVREALSGERMLALALLRPGWESDYHGSPEFFPLGCLARFEEVEWLPNDCYDLRVTGLARVRFERIVREYPYRAARVQVLPQEPYSEDDPLVQIERRALLEIYDRIAEAGDAERPAADTSYERLVNGLCMELAPSAEARMSLLELDSVLERGRRIAEIASSRRARRPSPPRGGGGEHN